MKRHWLSLIALAAGMALGWITLRLPTPAPSDADGFSARRAFADIKAISHAPHSVWDQDSLTAVRDHIRRRLAGMGLTPVTTRYPEITDKRGHRYPLENISAALPGVSGSSLLLVSHYDSEPSSKGDSSFGAADDGYGVAAMLEIAGILTKSKMPRQNGVRFLFTDAEETGLHGASTELLRNLPAYRDVNLVINLEARGIRGPAVMFETGRNSLATMEIFKAARWPFAYSFASDVYRRMPNGTDFSEFTRRGFAGLNFAVLDDLSYYHTPRDNPQNVSLESLQHYGEQILPIVQTYARSTAYSGKEAFASTQNMVYFTWLPHMFFAWSSVQDLFLCIGLALACCIWAARSISKGYAKPGASLLWFLGWFGAAFIALATGLGISFLLSKITGIRWRIAYMPNVPFERMLLWGLVFLLALAVYVLAGRYARPSFHNRSALIGAIGVNLAMMAAMLFILPGGTFLFSIPLLVSLAALILADISGPPAIALTGVIFTVSFMIPVLHMLFLALTIGALGIVLLMAFFAAALAGCLAHHRQLH